jgi:uncharacterized Zn finger protein (UPF0148 family)
MLASNLIMPQRPSSNRESIYCTICRRSVQVERPKDGNQVFCPMCGTVMWLTNTKPDTDLIIMVEGMVVEPLPFDQQQWETASMRTRGNMAADLISTRRLIKLSRDEVIELLGRPGGVASRSIWYGVDLGRRDDFRGLSYRLRITFNQEGQTKVVELEKHHLR